MLKTIFQSLITKGVVAAINFGVLILSSRYLGVNSRGEISIFILNISIVQVITGIYGGYGMVRFIPQFDLKKIVAGGIGFIIASTALINSAIVLAGKQPEANYWLGYFTSLLVILNTFNCIFLLGKENIKMFNLLSIIQPLLLLLGIAFCVLVLKIYTFHAYLYPLLFSFGAVIVVSATLVLKYLSHSGSPKTYNFYELVKDGFVFQLGLVLFIFINRFTYYLLPARAELGLYSCAVSLTESVLIIANGIAPLILSKVANRPGSRDNVTLSLSLTKLAFVLSLVCSIVLILLPEQFFVLVFGKGFAGIKELITAYLPAVLAASIFIPLTSYFTAVGKQKINMVAYSIGLILTLTIAPYMVSEFGPFGAAISTVIAYCAITLFLLGLFIFSSRMRISEFLSVKNDLRNLRELLFSSQAR